MTTSRCTCQLVAEPGTDGRVHHGLVRLADSEFPVRVVLGVANGSGFSLQTSDRLKQLLAPHTRALQQGLSSNSTVDAFVTHFLDILECVTGQEGVGPGLSAHGVRVLWSELEAVGWDNVLDMHPNMHEVTLKILDESQRVHSLHIQLTPEYPRSAPLCFMPLPVPVSLRWVHGNNLQDAISQYRAVLHTLEPLWVQLEDLDANAWVVEPIRPTRDIVMRRVALGNNSTIQLDLDPLKPNAVPSMKFIGSDSTIGPLRQRANSGLQAWDVSVSLRINLSRLLGQELPSRGDDSSQDPGMSGECRICTLFRLEDALPDRVCDNPRCAWPYHQECLFEWLRSLPNSRRSFDTIFGGCINCGHPMAVKSVQK